MPTLYVIAGYNGSGKSRFFTEISDEISSFDFDIIKMGKEKEFDYLGEYAESKAFEETEKFFYNQLENALENKKDFAYQTNFHSNPKSIFSKFKKNGYNIHLTYLCLDSIQKAKYRVDLRVSNGGHFVPIEQIRNRFKKGYKNLEKLFSEFDILQLFDTSQNSKPPELILEIKNNIITKKKDCPAYLKSYLSKVFDFANEPK